MSKRSTLVQSAMVAFMVAVSALPAWAGTIQFQEDVSPDSAYQGIAIDIRSNAVYQDYNREGAQTLMVGRISGAGTDDVRALLGFDISSIPAGSTITSVSLQLYGRGPDSSSVDQTFTINLHQLTGSIIEGAGTPGFDNTPGTSGPSWNSRDISDSTAWATPGGDYASAVLSSASGNPKKLALGTSLLFNSSADFVTAAQAALDGSGTLYMLARATSEDTASRGLFRLSGDDSPEGAQYRPQLTVTYEVPEPGCLLLILIGITAVARRR